MYQRRPTRLSWFRLATASRRMLPQFLVLGTQRGGSTSLYRWISAHPWVVPAVRKECHFFDFNFPRGVNWYRAHFPLTWTRDRVERREGRPLVTGEGSPYYLLHPHAPRRAAATVPGARLVALLRNPVERAYSHYQLAKRAGGEALSFEDAIAAEKERVGDDLERMRADDTYYSRAHHKFTYVARGLYADQVRAWRAHFPAEQLLVVPSEEMFKQPEETYARVLAHLGLPPHALPKHRRHNAGTYEPMDAETRRRLVEYYEPHNRELYELLGRDLGWR